MGAPRKAYSTKGIQHFLKGGSVAAKDGNIKEIAHIMATGVWHPHKSVVEYAKTAGLQEVTVKEYAAEAARLLRLAWTDETARVAILEKIYQVGNDAANRTEEVIDKDGCVRTVRRPDYKTQVTALNSVAAILGMNRQQIDVNHNYEGMTDAQLFEAAKRHMKSSTGKPFPAPPKPILETTSHEQREDRQEAEVHVPSPKGSDDGG
ncbi:MAG: hypothetical protein WDO74_17980 [Pseudomonadota bacterium]